MTHTTDIQRVFHAGLTTRWHTNPWLAQTCDRLDGHQGRVTRLILALWPDASRDLLIDALTHDDGESVTGDIPATYDKTLEQKADEVNALVDIWNGGWGDDFHAFASEDSKRLRLADKLDAYMWAEHHAPAVVLENPEWSEAWQEIVRMAVELGVEDRL